MGKTADELEVEVERRRHALTARVDRLDSRVRDDIHRLRSRSSERVEHVKEAAQSSVTETLGTHAGSDTEIAKHPRALIAGAAAGGAVLGLATSSSDENEGSSQGDSRRGRDTSSNGETGVFGLLASTVQDVIAFQKEALAAAAVDVATSGLKSIVGAGEKQDSDSRAAAKSRAGGLPPPSLPPPHEFGPLEPV